MEIRSLLVRLHDVIDAGTILRMKGATLDDVELIAVIEDLAREDQKGNKGGGDDGG